MGSVVCSLKPDSKKLLKSKQNLKSYKVLKKLSNVFTTSKFSSTLEVFENPRYIQCYFNVYLATSTSENALISTNFDVQNVNFDINLDVNDLVQTFIPQKTPFFAILDFVDVFYKFFDQKNSET
jgi:rRNA maturation endonuclease Nob1